MKKYDYLLVGSGLYAAEERLAEKWNEEYRNIYTDF